MTSVCKWLGLYLCIKEPSHHAALVESLPLKGNYKCDMLITLKESKESSGGMAFDVILKPALQNSLPVILMRNVPGKDISQEDIDRKLREAEDRRIAVETQKLMTVQKDRERAYEASQRLQEINDSFVKEVEKKLQEKMEVSNEIKSTQIKQLQDKLKEHAQRVEEIRRMGERSKDELRERIDRKLEDASEKRESKLSKVQERIRQHQRHIEEVIECSSRFSRDTEERIIIKMENSLKNREEHLNCLLDRLKKHEDHIQEIRQNKMNQSTSSSSSFNDDTFCMLDEEVMQFCWKGKQENTPDDFADVKDLKTDATGEKEKNENEKNEKDENAKLMNVVKRDVEEDMMAPYVVAEEEDEEEEEEDEQEYDQEGDAVDSLNLKQNMVEKEKNEDTDRHEEVKKEEEKLLIDLNNDIEVSTAPLQSDQESLIDIQPTFVNKAYNEVFNDNAAFDELFHNDKVTNNYSNNNRNNYSNHIINNTIDSSSFKDFCNEETYSQVENISATNEIKEKEITKTTTDLVKDEVLRGNEFRDVNVVVIKNLNLGARAEAEKVFIDNDDEYNDEDDEEDDDEEDDDEDDDDEIINYDEIEDDDEEVYDEEEDCDYEKVEVEKEEIKLIEKEINITDEEIYDEMYEDEDDEEEELLEKEIEELEKEAENNEQEKNDKFELKNNLLQERKDVERLIDEDDDESFPPPPCSEDILSLPIRLEIM